MERIGSIMMVDGGWGFPLIVSDDTPRFWIAFERERDAVDARAAMADILRKAIWLADVNMREEQIEAAQRAAL